MKEKFMKFIEEKWRILVIIIALIFIGMGVIQALTDFRIDPQKSHNIELVLMVIAISLFFNGKKKEQQANMKEETEETEETEEIEEIKEISKKNNI